MTTLSIFGLGYVGCVSAACFAKEGHTVIGVDVSESKVAMVNAGRATIVEHGIADLVREMVESGKLRATTDVADAVRSSTVSIICVGTPSRKNGSLDLAYVERVAAQIGEVIGQKHERHTVVVRSTVLPGTTESIVVPILERASGKKAGVDFGVCMNPEFLREGTSIQDFYRPPFTLIGTSDPASADAVKPLYQTIDAALHVTQTGVAEMIKYACNSFHGLKVAFANEIGIIAKSIGVDSHEVMRLFCEDRKLNISPAYLRPGFAFGGSCLPKDLRALAYRAQQSDLEVPVLRATLDSNQKHIKRAVDQVLSSGTRKVGVLGLSFKAGTDDLRESPMVTLIEALIGKGLTLAIYDREVTSARVMGSNREYVEREIPHIWSLMKPSVQDVLSASDLVIVGNSSPEFSEIGGKLREGQRVLDLVRAFGAKTSDGAGYEGICW